MAKIDFEIDYIKRLKQNKLTTPRFAFITFEKECDYDRAINFNKILTEA